MTATVQPTALQRIASARRIVEDYRTAANVDTEVGRCSANLLGAMAADLLADVVADLEGARADVVSEHDEMARLIHDAWAYKRLADNALAVLRGVSRLLGNDEPAEAHYRVLHFLLHAHDAPKVVQS